MDAAAHYRHLLSLGRDEFLAAAAPGVLVRHRLDAPDPAVTGTRTLTMDEDEAGEPEAGELVDERSESRAGRSPDWIDETMPHGKLSPESADMELYPLVKKPGASFPDRITIGRTPNNDVAIGEHSVSRLHAYVRGAPGARASGPGGWVVADAGSKNGSWLDDVPLEPRREVALAPGAVLRLGDVILTFYRSADLFDLLGDDHGRR
jgi:FHA domain-containing protein